MTFPQTVTGLDARTGYRCAPIRAETGSAKLYKSTRPSPTKNLSALGPIFQRQERLLNERSARHLLYCCPCRPSDARLVEAGRPCIQAKSEALAMSTPVTDNGTIKDPTEWTTGDEPMTGAQDSYLHTLARKAGEGGGTI